MRNKYIFSIIIIALLLSPSSLIVQAAENFNPNYIISDQELLDYNSMTLNEIQRFLENKGSYLAKYQCNNAYGDIKSAAEIIYEAATNNYDCDGVDVDSNASEAERKEKCIPIGTVNPKFLLVLLQKEMSLIEDKTPTVKQLNWATGYGCPDGGNGCNSQWKGFGKQVNSAALQFYSYMKEPNLYTYKAGGSYTFTNPYSTTIQATSFVTPLNQATAALYNYTPHVYNGNYSFYKLWQKYFTKTYYDGSLLQAEGESGVWLIQGGKKRPFLSRGALISRFDPFKIITVTPSDLDKYEVGNPIKFPQYSVVKSSESELYLLVDDTKRKFADYEAFRKIGINPEEIIDANSDDLRYYKNGEPITTSSTYITGSLLQNKETGGVYWVIGDTKAPLLDPIFLKTIFANKKIIPVDPEELENYKKIKPVTFEDGTLMKGDTSSAVYVISNGKKHPIISGQVFENLGYKWENVITVPQRILQLHEVGETITLDET